MHQAEKDLIVLTAQQGSHKAFSQLVQYYQKPLLRFAYKLCNDKELANDALQEAWIKIARSLHQLNDPRAFKSWLYRIVCWRVLDMLRQHKKLNEDSHFAIDNLSDINSINEQSSDEQQALSYAINRLPKIEKQIVHLFYLDEMKLIEISIVLSIPVGTVKSRLSRARNLLKQKLEI